METTDCNRKLREKLVEESHEVLNASTEKDLREEMADASEVLAALAATQNLDLKAIQDIGLAKKLKNGSFDNLIYLHSVGIPASHPIIHDYESKHPLYQKITAKEFDQASNPLKSQKSTG